MAEALRTVVVAHDRRYLRALARVLESETELQLCGFADDLRTAETVAHAVRAQLILLDVRMRGVQQAAWPPAARRIFLVGEGDRPPATQASAASVAPERLATELPRALRQLFPVEAK